MNSSKTLGRKSRDPIKASIYAHFRVTVPRLEAWKAKASPESFTAWATRILDGAAGYVPTETNFEPDNNSTE